MLRSSCCRSVAKCNDKQFITSLILAANCKRAARPQWPASSRPSQFRHQSSSPDNDGPSEIAIGGRSYKTDAWTNVPPQILSSVHRRLHLQPDHPLSITRQLIESRFPNFAYHNTYHPVVTPAQNFDSLSIPADHPSRSPKDTYYLNAGHLLRTHTSAHEEDTFRANASAGWLISADVYRRDAVDARHYPVFHQMEGARTWDRAAGGSSVADQVWRDFAALPAHGVVVDDPNPPTHPERNPLQPEHAPEEAEAVAAHMKRSIENAVVEIFSKAKQAAAAAGDASASTAARAPLRVRWVEAYFPFTSPSWELEVFWQGDWLEVLGCGVTLQRLLRNSGVPDRVGWAFGIGLERVAMLLFDIPDIRLFWSTDPRFLGQFRERGEVRRFVPFSRHPECYKDVSFWLPPAKEKANGREGGEGAAGFHENDLMEVIRTEAGDIVEDVALTDQFTHPSTGRQSRLYRINYRSLERTLTNAEVNELHSRVCDELVRKLGVEIR